VFRSFPLQEQGVNAEAPPLRPDIIERMKSDEEIVARVIKSYEMMLDFYGMRLLSAETGLLTRVEPDEKRVAQYNNLASERINAIIKTEIHEHEQAVYTTISA
jgi:hypothetical protein